MIPFDTHVIACFGPNPGLPSAVSESNPWRFLRNVWRHQWNSEAIQFGFIAMFSLSFLGACCLAFPNNVVEMRWDANKLCMILETLASRGSGDRDMEQYLHGAHQGRWLWRLSPMFHWCYLPRNSEIHSQRRIVRFYLFQIYSCRARVVSIVVLDLLDLDVLYRSYSYLFIYSVSALARWSLGQEENSFT
jgi:hypothetical protein